MINLDSYQDLLAPISHFLQCATPEEWITEARKPENLTTILLDHLLCELKAGQSAMYLIRKYAVDQSSAHVLLDWFKPYEDFAYRKTGSLETLKGKSNISKAIIAKSDSPYSQELIDKMVLLIKEELHHFYQVLEIMHSRGIEYQNIAASRYAKSLISHMKTHEPETLIDKLIIGAYIEARSCERFAKLAPHMDDDIARFYISLLRSEARHYQDYLLLAEQIAGQDISERVAYFGRVEAELISTPDNDFKFHSGIPLCDVA
ncbi:tRNA isopentenyl-2-thiomethyl-A-37 hydroxylase MiaE [Vibrio sp. CAU 1672]|uniref:tRNA isopentenyl-2-thiomethyl-A-37 hydroxylase MiaE n=1 Tax=Vibrio sp. CAU 1672 TaxID=3032594 RepID=UPI0023DA5FE5|nr:tRNA isopentenyl-2-thiomethyl-A-37 hydroxylase MiaE [Vibrio sp. CAU 1672]MDF2152512.1 tRNA isopentenyl-2-thiomethyl-A-37 hydroxylase MiaE [Vibrio sp. CAU 1672]